MKIKSVSFIVLLLVFVSWSCEKFDGARTITGMWRVQEITPEGDYRVYNVSIEPFGNNDSTKFEIFNFNNSGMDIGTFVELDDSLFTIIPSSGIVRGDGVFHEKSFTIDWEYYVSGNSLVAAQAHYEKP